MASLQPAQTVNAGAVERLRFVLRGNGAASCDIVVANGTGANLRPAGKQGFVLDVEGWTSVTLALRSRTGSPIQGQVVVEITPFDAGGRRPGFDMTDIQAVGQREILLLELEVQDSHDCTLTSLIGVRRTPDPEGGAEDTRNTRVPAGPLSAVCLVDRSASMAWTFQAGFLKAILNGIGAACDEALAGRVPRCFTFGAPSEGRQQLSELPVAKSLNMLDIQVDMFSSGSRIPWEELSPVPADIAFIVTDDPHPAPSATVIGSKWVSFIRPSSPAPVQGQPADLQEQVEACRSAGSEILLLEPNAAETVEASVSAWALGQIGQCVMHGEGA